MVTVETKKDIMLTVEEAADRAGVNIESVRRWIRAGKFPAALPSRKKGYLIRPVDLEVFLQNKNQVKQRGQIEAEKVLVALAQAWRETRDKRYQRIAYEVAEISGLLEEYRRGWNAWDGNVADPDVDGETLRQRESAKRLGNDKQLAELEGRLILQGMAKRLIRLI